MQRISIKSIPWLITVFGLFAGCYGLQAEINKKGCNSLWEYKCAGGNDTVCIPWTKVKDGVPDCPDGSDEACETHQFNCGSADPLCIDLTRVYDGNIDCANGRDEGCPEGSFICKDRSACISSAQYRDGTRHCSDGSDEECPPGEFQCSDSGKCIHQSKFQDGVNDCGDGSDEECLPSQHECLCGFPRCLDKKLVNDGIPDCTEGSDEGHVDKSAIVCPEEDLQGLLATDRKRRTSDSSITDTTEAEIIEEPTTLGHSEPLNPALDEPHVIIKDVFGDEESPFEQDDVLDENDQTTLSANEEPSESSFIGYDEEEKEPSTTEKLPKDEISKDHQSHVSTLEDLSATERKVPEKSSISGTSDRIHETSRSKGALFSSGRSATAFGSTLRPRFRSNDGTTSDRSLRPSLSDGGNLYTLSTTYSYFNTILDGGTSSLVNSTSIETNVVTLPSAFGQSDYRALSTKFDTATTSTTTTYLGTKFDGDDELVESTEEVIAQVVITEAPYIPTSNVPIRPTKSGHSSRTKTQNIPYSRLGDRGSTSKSRGREPSIQRATASFSSPGSFQRSPASHSSPATYRSFTSPSSLSPSFQHTTTGSLSSSFTDGVPSYATKTYYTTYTYFTTYLVGESTSITSSTEITSNVVTELAGNALRTSSPTRSSPLSTEVNAGPSEEMTTRTYYTTFTYFTTFLQGSDTTVTSNRVITSNIVTEPVSKKASKETQTPVSPTLDDKLEIKITPTASAALSFEQSLTSSLTPTLLGQHKNNNNNGRVKTLYTTYTYFTTFLEGTETIISSSKQTISNVVTESPAITPTSVIGTSDSTSAPSFSETQLPSDLSAEALKTLATTTSADHESSTSSDESVQSASKTSGIEPTSSSSADHSSPSSEVTPTPPSSATTTSAVIFPSNFSQNESTNTTEKDFFTNATEDSSNSTIVAEESSHEDSLAVTVDGVLHDDAFVDNATTAKPSTNGSSPTFNIGPMLSGLAGLLINGGLALGAGAAGGGGGGNLANGFGPPVITNRNDTERITGHVNANNAHLDPNFVARPPAAATVSGVQEPNFIPVGGLGASRSRNQGAHPGINVFSPASTLRTSEGFTRIDGPPLNMPHPGIVIDMNRQPTPPAEHLEKPIPVMVLQPSLEPMFHGGFRPGPTEKGFTPITGFDEATEALPSDRTAAPSEKPSPSTTHPTLMFTNGDAMKTRPSSAVKVTTLKSVLQGESTIFFSRPRPQRHKPSAIPTIALVGSDSDEIGFTRYPSVSTLIQGGSTTFSTVWIQVANTRVDEANADVATQRPDDGGGVGGGVTLLTEETTRLIQPSTTTYYTTHTFYTTTFLHGSPVVNTRKETSSEIVVLRPLVTDVEGGTTRHALTIETYGATERTDRPADFTATAQLPAAPVDDAHLRDDGIGGSVAQVQDSGLRHKFITDSVVAVAPTLAVAAAEVGSDVTTTTTTSLPSDGSVIQSTFGDAGESTEASAGHHHGGAVQQVVQQDEQTHYTVAHYFTELADQASPVVLDRQETSSDIVTLPPTTYATYVPQAVTRTYFTTYFYYTTSMIGDRSVINSRAETSTNVVTLGPFTETEILPTTTEPTIRGTATVPLEHTDGHVSAAGEDGAHVVESSLRAPSPGYATYYTRYTYFTTYWRAGTQSVTSNIVTYTQVVPQITRTVLYGDGSYDGMGSGVHLNIRPTLIRDGIPGLVTRLPDGEVTAYRVIDGTRTVLYVNNGAIRTLLSTRLSGVRATTTYVAGGASGVGVAGGGVRATTTYVAGGASGVDVAGGGVRATTTYVAGGASGVDVTGGGLGIDVAGGALGIDATKTLKTTSVLTTTVTETVNGGTRTVVKYITPTVTTVATVTETVKEGAGLGVTKGTVTVGSPSDTDGGKDSTGGTVEATGGGGIDIVGSIATDGTAVTGTDGKTPLLKTEFLTETEGTARTVIGTRTSVIFTAGYPETKRFPFTTTLPARTMILTIIGGQRTITRYLTATTTATTTTATDAPRPVGDKDATVRPFTVHVDSSVGQQTEGKYSIAVGVRPGYTTSRSITIGETITVGAGGGFTAHVGEPSGQTTPKSPIGILDVDTSDINKEVEVVRPSKPSTTTPAPSQEGKAGGLHGITTKCTLYCDSTKREMCRFFQLQQRCGCRPGEDRVDRTKTCEPVMTYELLLNLVSNGGKDIVYTDSYRSYQSNDYQALANKCKIGLRRAYTNTSISQAFRGSEVIGFEDARLTNPDWKGVIARVAVNVRKRETVESQIIRDELAKSMQQSNYSLGGTDLYGYPVKEGLRIRDLDECNTPDFNGCSPNASCINLQGTYRCLCHEPLSSLDPEFPGRVCGAIEVCDYCNYQGECIPHADGSITCNCYPWHLGSQCQINGLALAIILPILLALLLLALLIWCCCCRKGGCYGMGPCCRGAACCQPGGCCGCCAKSQNQRLANVAATTGSSAGGVFPRIGGSIDEGVGTLDKKAMITEDSASDSSGEQSRFAHIADAFGARATDTQRSKKMGKMSGLGYEDRSLSGYADVPPVVIPRAKHQHPKQYVSSSTENILQRSETNEMMSAENKLLNILEGESQHERSMGLSKQSSTFATMPSIVRSKSQVAAGARAATVDRSDQRHHQMRSALAAEGTMGSSSGMAAHRSGAASAERHSHTSSMNVNATSSSGYDHMSGNLHSASAAVHSTGKQSKSKQTSGQQMSHSSIFHEESQTKSQGYSAGGSASRGARGQALAMGSGSASRDAGMLRSTSDAREMGGGGRGMSSSYYHREVEYDANEILEAIREGGAVARRYRKGELGGDEMIRREGRYRDSTDSRADRDYHSEMITESESYSKAMQSGSSIDMDPDYDANSSRYDGNSFGRYGTRTVSEVRSCDETTIHPATRHLGSDSYYSSSKGRSSRYTRTEEDIDPTDHDENVTDVSVSTMTVPNTQIFYKEDSGDYSESSDHSMSTTVRHDHRERDMYNAGPSGGRYQRQAYYNFERSETKTTKYDGSRS